MKPSTKLVRNSSVIFRVIEEEGVIYDPNTKRLHMLNKTALMAWDLWDGKHTLEDIVEAIVSEYEADAEQVMNDVTNCAGELCQHGLLNDAV